ncbi:MAG: RagB/SusD family nutrient uptake outer membrane protein, partial [Chitinophagaceae bacterium]
MKHKIFRYSLVFVIVLAMNTGCKKLLEETPRTSFTPEYFKTTEGLKGAVTGLYSSLRRHWGTQIFLQLQSAGTDETLKGAAADVQEWYTYNNPVIKSNLNIMAGFWAAMFQDINTANGILEYIESANVSATDKALIIASAKFFRG